MTGNVIEKADEQPKKLFPPPHSELGYATQSGRDTSKMGFHGEVAERLNAPVLKTGVSERAPWVRIPPSPLGLAMQSDAMCGRNPRFYRGFLRFFRVARETNPGFRQCHLMQTHDHLMSGEWHQFWHLSAPLRAPCHGLVSRSHPTPRLFSQQSTDWFWGTPEWPVWGAR